MGAEVGRERVRRGKSLNLAVTLFNHRAALEHEFWSRYGWGGDEIVRGVRGWNLASMLVDEILHDPYSHLSAAVAGWAYVPAPEDALFFNWVDATAQMRHQSGKVPPRPVGRPWEAQRLRPQAMPDPERKARRAALDARLGLGGVVEADDEPDGQPEA